MHDEIASNEEVLGREKPQTHGSHKLSSTLGTITGPHFLTKASMSGSMSLER